MPTRRQVPETKRRIPRQARATETAAAILEGAAQILEANGLAGFTTNAVAERAVTLGGRAYGTTRYVATKSKLSEYPQDTVRDSEHVKLLADRFDGYLGGVRESRALAEQLGDTDTADLLTQIVTSFEKHAWFLQASLA